MKYTKETSIAVVGASADPQKYGHKVFRDLLGNNYKLVGVNPKGEEILRQVIYKSLSEIKQKIDLVIMVVPPQIGVTVVQECIKLGINDVWLQPGSESSELIEYAQVNNINLTYNSCFMTEQGIW